MSKVVERYNTAVRQAISDELVNCSKIRSELIKKYSEVCSRLKTESESLIHSEYIRLEAEAESLRKELDALSIEYGVWDKARDICLNIADQIL